MIPTFLKELDTIDYVFFGLCVIGLCIGFIRNRRLTKAIKFRKDLFDLAEAWDEKHQEEINECPGKTALFWFIKIFPTYDQLLTRRPPYHLEDWFSPEIIERLKS